MTLHISLSRFESDIMLSSLSLVSSSAFNRVLYFDFFSITESPIDDSDSSTLVMLNPCSYFSIFFIFL